MNEFNSQTLREFVDSQLAGTDCFIVKAEVKKGAALVEIDSDTRVDIDFVAELNRKIEEHFAPEIDSYDLEVGSVGLTSPMVLPRQFKKNVGNVVSVLSSDGKKYKGMLKEADDEGFIIVSEEKVRKEGQKRPVIEPVERRFSYPEAKQVVYEIKF